MTFSLSKDTITVKVQVEDGYDDGNLLQRHAAKEQPVQQSQAKQASEAKPGPRHPGGGVAAAACTRGAPTTWFEKDPHQTFAPPKRRVPPTLGRQLPCRETQTNKGAIASTSESGDESIVVA